MITTIKNREAAFSLETPIYRLSICVTCLVSAYAHTALHGLTALKQSIQRPSQID